MNPPRDASAALEFATECSPAIDGNSFETVRDLSYLRSENNLRVFPIVRILPVYTNISSLDISAATDVFSKEDRALFF